MLVQEASDKILLLPAWPANWDTEFKLHLAGQTIITGTVKEGVLQSWDIEPASRRNDVVLYEPQKIPVRPDLPVNNHPLRLGNDSRSGSKSTERFGMDCSLKRRHTY
jgi:hypothetical protein